MRLEVNGVRSAERYEIMRHKPKQLTILTVAWHRTAFKVIVFVIFRRKLKYVELELDYKCCLSNRIDRSCIRQFLSDSYLLCHLFSPE